MKRETHCWPLDSGIYHLCLGSSPLLCYQRLQARQPQLTVSRCKGSWHHQRVHKSVCSALKEKPPRPQVCSFGCPPSKGTLFPSFNHLATAHLSSFNTQLKHHFLWKLLQSWCFSSVSFAIFSLFLWCHHLSWPLNDPSTCLSSFMWASGKQEACFIQLLSPAPAYHLIHCSSSINACEWSSMQ